MITHLLLRKFQSWKRADVELAPITIITGRGNTGKSALLRAIKYALTNRGGDDFIRYGAGTTQVGLTFDDGPLLLWTKARGRGGEYDLWEDGTKRSFSKTGTTVPQEMVDASRIRPLEVEKGVVLYPQLRLQFDGPFLLTESGTRIARTLGKLTKLDVLVNAQMQVRRERDEEQREQDRVQKRIATLQEKLAEIPDIKQLWEKYYAALDASEKAKALAVKTAKANTAAAKIRTHSTAKRQRLNEFIQAGEAVNVLGWRLRRATGLAQGYAAHLKQRAACVTTLEQAEARLATGGCCRG